VFWVLSSEARKHIMQTHRYRLSVAGAHFVVDNVIGAGHKQAIVTLVQVRLFSDVAFL